MKIILLTAISLSIIAACSAITCYECQGEDCEDPFDQEAITTTCTGSTFLPNNYCRKYLVGTSVTRSCGHDGLNECTPGCTSDTVCTYCCTKNLCNSGHALTTNFVAMGVSISVALFFSIP